MRNIRGEFQDISCMVDEICRVLFGYDMVEEADEIIWRSFLFDIYLVISEQYVLSEKIIGTNT